MIGFFLLFRSQHVFVSGDDDAAAWWEPCERVLATALPGGFVNSAAYYRAVDAATAAGLRMSRP